ncbi:MAG: hypothetical protein JW927_07950 [Deltaproteobacteria bacterium]|nr:hypothetical protein [Deltaproteobacteria bacterium]
MDLKPEWRQKYDILKSFIESNPEISIGKWETSIPKSLRDEFYSRFDQVRNAFVKSWESRFFVDICALGKAYVEAEERLFKILALKKHIELQVDLATILHTPHEGMMRLIYDRLFELVQGKITENDFERVAQENLNQNALEMFRFGYELWAAISIMLLLDPDEIFRVSLDENDKPFVSELDQIVIGAQHHHAAKRIPEFILHSKRVNAYIAFKMPLRGEVDYYNLPTELPTQRMLRDRTGDTSMALADRMIFMSVIQDLNNIPVFAELHERKINSPDLTIEFLMENDFGDTKAVMQIQNRADIMKPRLGGNIVLMNQKSLSGNFKIKENLETFSVGIDSKLLQPIIDKLI